MESKGTEVQVTITGGATSWQDFTEGIEITEKEAFISLSTENVPDLAAYLQQKEINIPDGAVIVIKTPLMFLRLKKNTDLHKVKIEVQEGRIVIVYTPVERVFWQNFQEEVETNDVRKEVTVSVGKGYFYSVGDLLSNKGIAVPEGYYVIVKTVNLSLRFPSSINLGWIGLEMDGGKSTFDLRSEFKGVFYLPSGDRINFAQRLEEFRPPAPQGVPDPNEINTKQNVHEKKPAQS